MIGKRPATRTPIGPALRFACVTFAMACSVSCAGGSSAVTRMADGVRYEGRFITPEAYAAYLLGVEHEARGQFNEALGAYLEAHAEDPDSAEIWARIGVVRCFSSEPKAGPSAARAAFERGLQLDPTYYGSYLGRARCAERARDFPSALRDATLAVARRPQDEPSNLLVGRALSALGRGAEARAWLEAYRNYYPATRATERALEAARGMESGSPAVAAGNEPVGSSRSAAFVELRSGRTERARQQAQSSSMPIRPTRTPGSRSSSPATPCATMRASTRRLAVCKRRASRRAALPSATCASCWPAEPAHRPASDRYRF